MRHQKKGRKLGRDASHRKAMLKNMITSLMDKGAIRTTDQKAKEARPLADKMITLAKKGDLHSRRQALRVIEDKTVVNKLFDEVAPKLADRNGGYTRIVKMGTRKGDGASVSLLQLVSLGAIQQKKKRKREEAEEAEAPKEETQEES